jgi:phosphoribosyl-AMP cyclohydrolase
MADTPLPIRFGDDALVPAVITDAHSGDVLMVGFMNDEALAQTRATGMVHFWSRSRRRLWKKGETSGHVQHVREIRVNCDLNSVLVEVEQAGAVCHDGYDTCFYRRLEPDNSLRIVRDRRFDPLDIYPPDGQPAGLSTQTRRWWSAYEWLRDHDLASHSGTSRRLRSERDESTSRVADELLELAGVVDGTHRHGDLADDLRLEAGQVLYWIACSAVWHGYSWDHVRPDRALDVSAEPAASAAMLARLLQARAHEIRDVARWPEAALMHETIALVAMTLRAHGIDPLDVINDDLRELAGKPYLPDVTALDS